MSTPARIIRVAAVSLMWWKRILGKPARSRWRLSLVMEPSPLAFFPTTTILPERCRRRYQCCCRGGAGASGEPSPACFYGDEKLRLADVRFEEAPDEPSGRQVVVHRRRASTGWTRAMQNPAYGLPRIHLPRTRVNKGGSGQGCSKIVMRSIMPP